MTAALRWRMGYKISNGTETTSGTWTNAVSVQVAIYSGVNRTTPFGALATTDLASSTTLEYPALTLTVSDGTSAVQGYGRTSTHNITTPPADMTLLVASASNTRVIVTSSTPVSSWASHSQTITTESVTSCAVELLAGITPGIVEPLTVGEQVTVAPLTPLRPGIVEPLTVGEQVTVRIAFPWDLARGYQPVWVLEVPQAGIYYATRSVTLNGQAYLPLLKVPAQLRRELLADDTQRVSAATVEVIHPNLVASLLASYVFDGMQATIRLGRFGDPSIQYTTLFVGPIDEWENTWNRWTITILDGSFQRHVVLPELPPAFFGTNVQITDILTQLITAYTPLLTIDADSFAAFAAVRSAWTFKGTVDADTPSRDFYARLARQAQGRYLESPTGLVRLVPIAPSGTLHKTVTAANIVPNSMQMARSPLDQCFTSIYVYFARDPLLGDRATKAAYTAVAVATPLGTTHPTDPLHVLCQMGQTALNGLDSRLDYFADMIDDATTAHLLLRFLVLWHTQRRMVLTCETWLNAANLDITQLVAVNHAMLPQRLQGSAFEIISRADHQHQIQLTLQEIHHPQWDMWIEHWGTIQGGSNPLPPGTDIPPTFMDPWEPTFQEALSINEEWEPDIVETQSIGELWN